MDIATAALAEQTDAPPAGVTTLSGGGLRLERKDACKVAEPPSNILYYTG